MAIAHHATVATLLDVAATTMNITLPAVAQGEVMLMWLYCTANPVLTLPAGWSPAPRLQSGTEDISGQGVMSLLYRVATASETTPVLTMSIAGRAIAVVSSYSGVDKINPLGRWIITEPGTTVSSIATTYTRALKDSWIVSAVGCRKSSDPGMTFTTSDASDVERVDATTVAGTTSNRPSLAVYDSNRTGPHGVAEARTFTFSASAVSASSAACSVELLADLMTGAGPISYVGTSTADASASSVAAVSVIPPVGIADGDLVVAVAAKYASPNTVQITPPPGWAKLPAYPRVGTYAESNVFYKVATASEPATYDFSVTGSGTIKFRVTVLVYRGANQSSPIGTWSAKSSDTNSTTHTNTPITTTKDGSWAITALGSTLTPTSTTSDLQDVERSEETLNQTVTVYDTNRSLTPGSTVDRTFTLSSAASRTIWTIELKSGVLPEAATSFRGDDGLWYSTADHEIGIYDGSAWQSVSNPTVTDIRVWDGSGWVSITS